MSFQTDSVSDQRRIVAAVAAAAAAAAAATATSVSSPTTAKRKLDDYAPSSFDDDEDFSDYAADLVTVRMRKSDTYAVHHATVHSSTTDGGGGSSSSPGTASSSSSATARVSDSRPLPSAELLSPPRLQFFVRMMSGGRTMVIQANSSDLVKSIHERIREVTGIPITEQRLIYRGRQLQEEQSLEECAIENDAGLHLVGRMRSTGYPQAWQVIDDMISVICRLCKGESVPYAMKIIQTRIDEYLSKVPKEDNANADRYLQIFMASSAPAALFVLYRSVIRGNKECADNLIRHFLESGKNLLAKSFTLCAPIVLEFCKLLRKVSQFDDSLYVTCRSALGSLLEVLGVSRLSKNVDAAKGVLSIQEISPFVSEIAHRLSEGVVPGSGIGGVVNSGSLQDDVKDFSKFLVPLRNALMEHVSFKGPISMPLPWRVYPANVCLTYDGAVQSLYDIFRDLLMKMDICLLKMEECMPKASSEDEIAHSGWSCYLSILKELNAISKLYVGADELLLSVLRQRKDPFCTLIVKFAKRMDDHQWILEHKDISFTNYDARRHLGMMMFPEVKEDYDEQHEMLIDRSQLLAESFEYIAHSEREALHGGLFMEFKNEEATGPGVLREWFVLVCHALFDQQRALFVACPNDRRRFYPNPASKVDPLHLEYFNFSGRMIALALMHKVQIGILLDRVFFLQLAGSSICLEDIQDADPVLYSSCKQILEMDAEFIDSDALGLTFVREVEELGSRGVVELCPGGHNIVVTSKNRYEYVNLLIKNRFVTSISEQVSRFAEGFGDILADTRQQKFFFQSLVLEDLDYMLYGSECDISVEDWKAHTEYNGYKETDPQITWFWKIMSEMSPTQRKNILFFWTSVKYLPVEGFRGLASRLYIYKSPESSSRLPSSHTCFYRLCFPPYSSMPIMRDRLHLISQEHVGSSFGTW